MTSKPSISVIGLKGLPAFGGAATVGESLIMALSYAYKFTVLSVNSHTKTENKVINGIPQVIFKSHGKGALNTLIYYFKSLWYALTHRFDIVHLHHAESGFITPFLRLKYNVIVTFHGIYNYNDPKFSGIHNWFFRFSERLNVRFANEIVSVSKPDVEYIKKKYGREIHYIPNGINITEKTEELMQKKKPKDYILFAAGRIYEIKGLHLLLEAMKQSNDSTLLKIAGDINQVPDYKLQIEELSKSLNTEFLGLIKEKNELMKLVSEAMMFGLPIITTNVGDNNILINNNKNGFLHEPKDCDSISTSLKMLISNYNLRLEFGFYSNKKVRQDYSITSMESKYLDLINKIIDEK